MNSRSYLIIALLLVVAGVVAVSPARAAEQTPTAEQLEFFEKEVRPLFVKHCYECHSAGAKRVEAKLLLDSRDAQLRGGDSGAAIEPGDADSSLLVELQREGHPNSLAPNELEWIVEWINRGQSGCGANVRSQVPVLAANAGTRTSG